MIILYKIASVILFPFIEIWLFYRTYKGKEDKKRLGERFGKTKIARPIGRGDIFWVHGVSIGEANSALILIDKILKNDKSCTIILTTTTTSSSKIINKEIIKYNGRVIHQFLPIDTLFCVKNFLNYWKFTKVFFIESEIWPNLIYESKNIGCKINLINARISNKSYNFWLFAKKFLRIKLFDQFDRIIVQRKEDIAKFKNLSNSEILFFGDLKSQSKPLLYDNSTLQIIAKQIDNRPVFLCSSTHENEEQELLKCYQKLKNKFSNLLLIIIPRHINRSTSLQKLFENYHLAVRSNNDNLTKKTEIYLVDTLAELGLFYKLCDFTFIGGSIVNAGGHNPYEAIKLQCAVICGNNIFNFEDIYHNLSENNGCIITKSNNEIIDNISKLIEDGKFQKTLVKNSLKVIDNNNFIDELVDILN
jgi:3-deoxy-D-manno-octulosonic-acid transferase